MSINQVSSFKPPVELISSRKYYSQKTNVFSLGKNEKNKLGIRRSQKMGVRNDDYTHSVTSPMRVEPECGNDNIANGGGIRIHEFFLRKNIFLTGSTGLLGKVLVEKLLRSTSVGKIYVLLKANDKEAALDRLSKEIIDSELFQCIREKHGKSYKEFVQAKLIPIVGNICEPNMGIDSFSANAIMEEVDVIIGSAANTNLNDRFDITLDANVNAPQRLMRFAKRCKNLKLFVHISTAYVNGKREGIMYEKPYTMGEHARNCNGDDEASSFPWLDLTEEFNLVKNSCTTDNNHDTAKFLQMLGQERCAYYGWNNSYQMSKALGEMIVNEIRDDVPVLIMRPSIIESSYKEPVPGWIQGMRVSDPALIAYGKGQLPSYFANPEAILDLIPVDMVANTTIAAIAKHGNAHKSRDLNVYHVASGFTNPLTISDFFEYAYGYFNETPLVDSQSLSRIKYFDNFTDFSKSIREEISRRFGVGDVINGQDERAIRKIQRHCNVIATYAEKISKIYEFAGFFNARFHTGNTQKLMAEMSKKEQLEFEVDARNINWKKYFQEIHLPGLRKYAISNSRN